MSARWKSAESMPTAGTHAHMRAIILGGACANVCIGKKLTNPYKMKR